MEDPATKKVTFKNGNNTGIEFQMYDASKYFSISSPTFINSLSNQLCLGIIAYKSALCSHKALLSDFVTSVGGLGQRMLVTQSCVVPVASLSVHKTFVAVTSLSQHKTLLKEVNKD